MQIEEEYYISHVLLCNIYNSITYSINKCKKQELIKSIPLLEKTQCPICLDYIKKYCKELPCGHVFCCECIDTWFDKEYTCPMCKKHISNYDI
tara:strand:- start:270 stop:548 length:279 start_codon:yes stop_codon:yes gene_type:complete